MKEEYLIVNKFMEKNGVNLKVVEDIVVYKIFFIWFMFFLSKVDIKIDNNI